MAKAQVVPGGVAGFRAGGGGTRGSRCLAPEDQQTTNQTKTQNVKFSIRSGILTVLCY